MPVDIEKSATETTLRVERAMKARERDKAILSRSREYLAIAEQVLHDALAELSTPLPRKPFNFLQK